MQDPWNFVYMLILNTKFGFTVTYVTKRMLHFKPFR